ncbi:MAG: hypothetical protein N2202_09575 [Proteobacteria bacterium]|nr:hypothetical protein [Pseudomonadota bacterium]
MIKDYQIKSIDNIVCLPGTGILRAVVETPEDISELFPYINGYVKKARYLPKIPWIRFPFSGFPEKTNGKYDIACRPNQIILGKFSSNEEAKDIVKQAIDFLNFIYKNRENITPSLKEWSPPSAIAILKYLPQTNCGKCGEKTCMSFAVKLSQGEAEVEKCADLTKNKLEFLREVL